MKQYKVYQIYYVQDFDTRRDQGLLAASEIPTEMVLEGSYKSKLQQFKTQYQKHHANVADELERYGFFNKSKARVTKHDDQNKEHHHEGANLDQSCRSARCHKRESQWLVV